MILLDSHIALWLALEPHKISPGAAAAIDAARRDGSGMAVCDITFAELATSYSKGRFTLTVPLDIFLEETESRFTVLPMTARICARIAFFPASFPRDPADRIITATALVHGLPLLTADRAIRRAKVVRTIW